MHARVLRPENPPERAVIRHRLLIVKVRRDKMLLQFTIIVIITSSVTILSLSVVQYPIVAIIIIILIYYLG